MQISTITRMDAKTHQYENITKSTLYETETSTQDERLIALANLLIAFQHESK